MGVGCTVSLRTFPGDRGTSCSDGSRSDRPVTGGDFVCTEATPLYEFRVRVECDGYLPLDTASFSFCTGGCRDVSLGTLTVTPRR